MKTDASTKSPKVSVVIPAYNTAHLIGTCLDSVFAQSFRDFEVIVVNDGSPDTPELEKVLQPRLQEIVYIRQENKRAAGARNTAIRAARGEYLAFLDSDDSWLPEHLASQMQLFEQDPDLDLAYANALQIGDARRRRTFMEQCPSEGPASFEALVLERCQIPVSTVVARKAVIAKAGLFNQSLTRCDDYDMWLRTAFFGAKIAYCRDPQARLSLGRPDSLGQSRAKMTEAYWRILEAAAQSLPLSDQQRELVCHRAAEIKARYLVEQGKLQLAQHPEKARELFREANLSLRMTKLRLAIRGLEVAPQTAGKILSVWNRFRRVVPV